MGILRRLSKRRGGGPSFYALFEGSTTFSLVFHDQKPDLFHQLPCRLTHHGVGVEAPRNLFG